jgi:prephenate dehydratase
MPGPVTIPGAAGDPHGGEDLGPVAAGTPARSASWPGTVAFLGPPGTFTEEALLGEPDLASAGLVPMSTIGEVLDATHEGRVEAGFVPIENSIEGTVAATIDHLIFDADLLLQREVVLDVHLHLMAPAGVRLEDVRRVVSFPHATAQCRGFFQRSLQGAELVASNSTAEAARLVGTERRHGTAALAPRLAAELYGLEIVAEAVEDHPDNQTRFMLVGRHRVPPPTGHDRTSIVCFQRADRPGSLHQILGQFAARSINLSKLESRPTKLGLGDYCFIIDLWGHVCDEVVGDCLRELRMELAEVKFLGSYPAASERGPELRREIEAARHEADDWLAELRRRVVIS